MNPSEIQMILTKVCSDLKYIERSQALQEIAQLPQADPALALIATTALDTAIQLRLKLGQALDQHLEQELDRVFEEVA